MNPSAPKIYSTARCRCDSCAEVLDLPEERLGRNTRCPACGARMTARRVEIADKLALQQERIGGVAGSPIPRLPLVVLVDNVRSLWNVGSIFRTADACGVRQLVLCGITGYPPRDQISKTALGAEHVVAWRYRADPHEGLDELLAEGFVPVAVETTSRAESLESFNWPKSVCLVIGSEVAGVSSRVLDDCPRHVRVSMRGVKDSLNVAVAFGIVAHHAAGQLELALTPTA